MQCPKCHSENPSDSSFCSKCGTQLPSFTEISSLSTKTYQTPIKELARGSIFAGRYEVVEELGEGGMGIVYKALDKELREPVALKLLKPEIAADEKTIERFRNELKIARKITHKNVCRMHDLNREEETYYITMEYVSGEDLKSLINRIGQFTVGKAVFIAKQICEGLVEAHRLGVVHRDLKPQNIMIDKEGNAHIMDFGIARSLRAKGITGTGVMIGTPEYMSPEQTEGKEVDGRSDIYSLGVILYEMVTGKTPFEGKTPLSIAMKHKSEEPPDPKKINPLKCLEKKKEKRYQRVEELISELNKIGKSVPTTERIIPKGKIRTKTISKANWKNLILYSSASLLLILLILASVYFFKGSRGKIESIAVLPLKNLSGVPEQEYFADGITEELISSLTQIKALKRVISRTSVMKYKGALKTIPEIARELGVDAIVEGSVSYAEQRVRITIQLIEAKSDRNIWSKSYERNLSNILVLQSELARAIAREIKVVLTPEEAARLGRARPVNTESYQLYLKGRHFWNKRTKESISKAIESFEKAIELDPNYALAYVGLADAYNMLGSYNLLPSNEAYPKAKAAALKALEIDDTLAEAYTSLAWVKYRFDWDWFGAEADFNWAIGLNPSYATAHQWYGALLRDMGRFEKARVEIERAQELNPLSLPINTSLGFLFYCERQYDQAIEQCKKAIQIDASFPWVHDVLGVSYLQKGDFEQAIKELQKAVKLSGSSPEYLADLGYGYARAGEKSEALKIFEELQEQSKHKYVPQYEMALIYAGLGQKGEAFAYLEKACDARSGSLFLLKVDPRLDSLRSDRRFLSLLERMDLE